MGFGSAVDLLRFPILLLFAQQRHLEALFHKPLAQTLHCARMHVERVFDLLIGPVLTMRTLVRLQQDPRVPLFVGRRLPPRDQTVQMSSLLCCQRDDVLFLGQYRSPLLTKGPQEKDTSPGLKTLVPMSRNPNWMNH